MPTLVRPLANNLEVWRCGRGVVDWTSVEAPRPSPAASLRIRAAAGLGVEAPARG